MKRKLTIFMFGLLLAVGWTSSAQAQLLAGAPAKRVKAPAQLNMNNPGAVPEVSELIKDFTPEPQSRPKEEMDIKSLVSNNGGMMRAPLRANYNQTAPATHVYSWYDAITYRWTDGTNSYTSKMTEPATEPAQMATLLGFAYVNPEIPGIKYTACWQVDHPYYNIGFGWDIPANARWNLTPSTGGDQLIYDDITIVTQSSYAYFDSIAVIADGEVLQAWSGMYGDWNESNGSAVLPSDWSSSKTVYFYSSGGQYYSNAYMSNGGTITIPASVVNGHSNVQVYVRAAANTNYTSYPYLTIAGTRYTLTTTWTEYIKDIDVSSSSSGSGMTTVTPPNENGYTVFLVKVKDYDTSTDAPETTSSWSAVLNYFDTYIDEVDLLTDGMRVEEGEVDAGTVFTYSGILNRFFFMSKGKMAYIPSNYSSSDRAPVYSMYEEFSPTTTASGDQITDFYSKMLEGESYDIIHDCQSVNYMQHFFSMSGKAGTDAKSLTNLIFYIPDNRGVYHDRNYNEEYQPKVGLYTIKLTADAEMIAPSDTTHQEGNRNYKVTINWESSLAHILEFDVDQDYELYTVVYDEQGNPVLDSLLTTTHNVTNYTYYVEQYPESYTITYRVKGWPSDATNSPAHDGNFFALSNLDDVLIPGWEDFLSLNLDHYESDFKINEEYNYYRNFFTVSNQTPDNQLTVRRVLDGENLFTLYRYDMPSGANKMKVAELAFSQDGNDIVYDITYFNQNILTGYDLQTLGIPVHGVVATYSGGYTPSTPNLSVSPASLTIDGNNGTTGTITVTGSNLTGDVTITASDGFTVSPATITPTNGSVNTTVTVTAPSGATTETTGTITIASTGATSKTVSVTYTPASTPTGTQYVKVTQSSQIVAGKKYILVSEDQNLAVTATNNGSSKLAGEAVTISNNTVTLATGSNVAEFTLGGSSNAWTLENGGKYLTGQNGTNLTMGTSSTANYALWRLNNNNGALSGYRVQSNQAETRAVLYFTTSVCFGHYAISNIGSSNAYSYAFLYVESDNGGSGTTTNPVGDITIEFGGTSSSGGNSGGNFSFSSIQVKSGGSVINGCSWTYATHGTSAPTGWTFVSNKGNTTFNDDGNNTSCYISGGGTLTIPSTMLNGATSVQVVVHGNCDASYTANPPTITVNGDDGGYGSITSTTAQDYTWTVNGTTSGSKAPVVANAPVANSQVVANAPMMADRDYTLINNAIDHNNFTTPSEGYLYVYPDAPWEAQSMRMQTSSYLYIQDGGYLKFTVPSGYNGADLKFVVHNAPSTSDYYRGTFVFTSSAGSSQTVTCNTGNQDYEVIFNNVSPGDVITITGTCIVSGTTYNYTPDFTYIYVYAQGGGSEYGLDEPLYLGEIQLVDQFKAETKYDAHPYRYGYHMEYDPETGNTEDVKKSSVRQIPVQHTGADLDGYYTLAEIDNDRDLYDFDALTPNVMNAEVEMTLADNPQVYYYTLNRKPSTANDWEELSKLQIRENGTYQEIYEKLVQYKEQECDPGEVLRWDNYNVQTGEYNYFMNYVPIVWTHGDLNSNKRIKWDTEKLHNSYGAPILKTGVGKVVVEDADAWQQSAGGAQGTSWTDVATGKTAWLYFLTLDAEATLPTVSTLTYEPYLFRVWINSPSGSLRGWNYVEGTQNVGAHFEGDGKSYTSWMLYEGRTDGTHLQIKYADKLKFAALADINDMEVVVRFYYIEQGGAAGHEFVPETSRAMTGPAGYAAQGSKSPDPQTAVNEIFSRGEVIGVTYVNAQGMQSDRPFDGMNIVVTRYSNGATTTTKVRY